MSENKRNRDDRALEALFASARRQAPEPGVDFLARVLGDAEAAQNDLARRAVAARPPRPEQSGLVWRLLRRLDLFGTHGLVGGGLVTAAVLGFGIGFMGSLGAPNWMGQLAPMLFETTADSAMTLLPSSDSFVIALGAEGETAGE